MLGTELLEKSRFCYHIPPGKLYTKYPVGNGYFVYEFCNSPQNLSKYLCNIPGEDSGVISPAAENG